MITTDVDLPREGRFGRAGELPTLPENPTGVGGWLLELPQAHPLWTHYLLSVVTLADLPGFPPAVKGRPEYTHELTLFAVHPGAELRVMTPANVLEQFTVAGDAQARAVGDAAVGWLLAGYRTAEPSGILGEHDAWSAWVKKAAGASA